jgi:predicted GIY-YIG superfamily endonuclease
MSNSKVQRCHHALCSICSQIIEGDSFKFACGFVFEVRENNFTCSSTDVIYVLRCTTCHAEYIGETNNLRHRIGTHCSHTRSNRRLCRATDHFVACGTDLPDVKSRFQVFVLERESDRYVRKAKESYYINVFKPRMNK